MSIDRDFDRLIAGTNDAGWDSAVNGQEDINSLLINNE